MSEYCCFLPRDKNTPLNEAKEVWQSLNGYFIGIGYIFPKEAEPQLENICLKAKMELHRLPTNGLSFEAYRDSYKLDFLRTKKLDKELKLNALMNKKGIQEIDEVMKSTSPSDQMLKDLIEEIDKTGAAIQRFEKAETARETIQSNENGLPLPYTFQDLLKDLNHVREGLKTGFQSIDALIEIPQAAITLIAGRPSHGKTITQLNLLVKMVKFYPEMKFYFFSYEETRSQILLKILNILSQDVISEKHNLANLEGYLRGGHKSRPMINNAAQALQELTESGRLIISDVPYHVDDLATIISKLKEKFGQNLGAIFIDYIQKIKIKSKHPTRQLELQKISEAILESAKANNLPIILGAQLGRGTGKKEVLRLDNLREAGDIENDSKLVIGIWNQSKEEESTMQNRKVELELVLLKNRNGPSNQSIFLEFDRPLSLLNEKPKNDSPLKDFSP
jgi:replicative DNA helicase